MERVHSCAVNLGDGKLVWRQAERCQVDSLLALDQGILSLGRDPATGAGGARARGGFPRSAHLARSHFVTRGYRGGGGGGTDPVCADDGKSVAWFDIVGRELRVHARGDFDRGQLHGKNASPATWKVAMPEGEVAAAVIIAGDAVVCATHRWSNTRYSTARYIAQPAAGPDPGPPGPGHLLVLSLADGGERQRFTLPQTVVHQGLAVHAGVLVVCGRDGLVAAYGPQ